jgi:hypothetical protein
MAEHAYRACPQCGTHNRHYMLVCTRCARSLESVALVGTPPPGWEAGASSGRLLRITLAALALLAAATLAVLLSRLLRSGAVEGRAAASTAAVSEPGAVLSPRPATPAGAWETLEERWAERPLIPSPPASATPSPAAVSPTTPVFSTSPPPATAPLVNAPPAAPVTLAAVPAAAGPSTFAAPEGPEPRPWRPPVARRVPPVAHESAPARDEDTDDPARARAALRHAEERLKRLERQAEELRAARDGDAFGQPEEQAARLARVLRRIEQAEREVIRAEWALRDAEQ